ncbi:YraN family protein [Candidatus Gottesmanbacteria bacterium]|nr:YraN family protein [Candidatus Gottesmanbacteria bacterium]
MKLFNKKTGALGEDLATEALRKKGYEILKRNFSNKFGEIDIIARNNGVLVFAEVKTKKGEEFGSPEEMINPKKLWKIRNMANLYMGRNDLPCRLDVVAIVLDQEDNLVRLTHYENIY